MYDRLRHRPRHVCATRMKRMRNVDVRSRGENAIIGGLLVAKPVPGLETLDVDGCDAIQVRADLPDRQDLAVDELVDRLAIELPAPRELRDGVPRGLGVYPRRRCCGRRCTVQNRRT
jgi:hypothetical protein